MLIVLVIFVLLKNLNIVVGLSWLSVVAIILMTILSLSIGYLWGKLREDSHTVLAVLCATHNHGLIPNSKKTVTFQFVIYSYILILYGLH